MDMNMNTGFFFMDNIDGYIRALEDLRIWIWICQIFQHGSYPSYGDTIIYQSSNESEMTGSCDITPIFFFEESRHRWFTVVKCCRILDDWSWQPYVTYLTGTSMSFPRKRSEVGVPSLVVSRISKTRDCGVSFAHLSCGVCCRLALSWAKIAPICLSVVC